MTSENSGPRASRRQFIGQAGAALAGFGLLGASQAHAGAHGGSDEMSGKMTPDALVGDLFDAPMQNGEYALPALPYAYDALEPHIDEQTMRLHHDIHFEGYRKGLNKALAMLSEARTTGDYNLVSHWQNQLAFNGAGYMLHLVFFGTMAPAGSTSPSAHLKEVMSRHFGSMEAFEKHFAAAASSVQGSGWGILGYQPVGSRLLVLQAEKHQNFTQWGIIPILAVDVWEHAYYLKYQNKRGEYVKNYLKVVNWDAVEKRIHNAAKLG